MPWGVIIFDDRVDVWLESYQGAVLEVTPFIGPTYYTNKSNKRVRKRLPGDPFIDDGSLQRAVTQAHEKRSMCFDRVERDMFPFFKTGVPAAFMTSVIQLEGGIRNTVYAHTVRRLSPSVAPHGPALVGPNPAVAFSGGSGGAFGGGGDGGAINSVSGAVAGEFGHRGAANVGGSAIAATGNGAFNGGGGAAFPNTGSGGRAVSGISGDAFSDGSDGDGNDGGMSTHAMVEALYRKKFPNAPLTLPRRSSQSSAGRPLGVTAADNNGRFSAVLQSLSVILVSAPGAGNGVHPFLLRLAHDLRAPRPARGRKPRPLDPTPFVQHIMFGMGGEDANDVLTKALSDHTVSGQARKVRLFLNICLKSCLQVFIIGLFNCFLNLSGAVSRTVLAVYSRFCIKYALS